MPGPVLTMGHSTRTLAEILDLLRENHVALVVDVRRLPGSRRYPWVDSEPFAASLAEAGIDYRWEQELTGRRPVSREVPLEVNAWWQNRSFHNYADHALSPQFADAVTALQRRATQQRAVLLCSEAVWWRCHRRIIADHLLARQTPVVHILGPGHVEPASLSAGAVVGASVTYPAR